MLHAGTAEEAAPQNSYGFTLKGLWDAMPVDFFFQVVGSGIDKAQAEELCAEDRHIGAPCSQPRFGFWILLSALQPAMNNSSQSSRPYQESCDP